MLNSDEEARLDSFLKRPDSEIQKDVTYAPEFYTSAVKWLATKLKEVNDELKVANIYSSTVAKELMELQKKQQ